MKEKASLEKPNGFVDGREGSEGISFATLVLLLLLLSWFFLGSEWGCDE
jgi:hypothetical protein